MKFLLLLLLITPALGQSIEDRVKQFESPKSYTVEYDKFAKRTSVSLDAEAKSSRKNPTYNLRMSAIVEIAPDGKASYSLYFRPLGYRVLYNNETLRFLVDGDLIEIPDTRIAYSVIFGITPEQFSKIASGKSVELQLSSFEGKVEGKTLRMLQNLESLTKLQPR